MLIDLLLPRFCCFLVVVILWCCLLLLIFGDFPAGESPVPFVPESTLLVFF